VFLKIQAGIRAAVFAVALVAAASTSAFSQPSDAAGDVYPYRSEAGRFSVAFPAGSPSVQELNGSKLSMTDNDAYHSVDHDGAEFAVEIHDIPRLAKLVLTSHFILDRTVEGKLEDIGAREVDSVETVLQGKPAREVDFEIPDQKFVGKLLFVLAERRLYLVSVQHPQPLDPLDSIPGFFESFSFWLE
jgi:hypothetical protein